ncbi:hypothetical protein TNIN_497411 [Trichonephila inaurata madagascariensis]|uniref:Uncharacterized protein n=1 Tax=Trichonephila inaurata madagascariensis TaxID=2747483 RepID=A0A8X7CH96_9ARAC|nr:hypothetical protein TNIN_497411 [Trichonephila inaurata madagascariensis]
MPRGPLWRFPKYLMSGRSGNHCSIIFHYQTGKPFKSTQDKGTQSIGGYNFIPVEIGKSTNVLNVNESSLSPLKYDIAKCVGSLSMKFQSSSHWTSLFH